jgi:Ca-activated chloride channel family protein
VSFAHPLWLIVALLLCAGFAWLYRTFERRREAQALAYSNLEFALDALRPSRIPGAALFAAWLIGAGTLALALAGPRFTAHVPVRDATVMICIDVSGSMRSTDVEPTRWQAAKSAARAFIDAVPEGTRVGIVSFSSDAAIIQGPISDLDVVRASLDRIPYPNGATAIGDALNVAASQMPPKGRRAIVLLTDGVNNRGSDPVTDSQQIGARGITISTVGVGTNDSGQLIPGTSEPAEIDEDALRAIASNGGGHYARAGDAGTLRDEFRSLALETVWEKRRVEAALPFAFGGGVLVVLTFLAGFALGRFP